MMNRSNVNTGSEAQLRKLGVSMVVLFGSAATGVKKPSDIDVAVFLNEVARKKTSADFMAQSEIIEALGDFLKESSDKVDTVFMSERTSPLLAYHIARDGKLLLGPEQDFMRFRLLAARRHYDSVKLYKNREQYLKQAYA